MSDLDNAATLEDGSLESIQAGGNFSHLSKSEQATIKRRAPQSRQKKTKFDVTAFLNQIKMQVESMSPSKLHGPFVKQQLDDLRHGDQPDGHHSTTLVLAVIAAAKTLPYATEAALDIAATNGVEINAIEPRVLEHT